MYQAYWQLNCRPFEDCADAQFYYPSEVHQGALLKLRYAIESQRAAALLTGASGSGKTLLVNSLKRQLSEQFTPLVHIVFPQMSSRELLAYLAEELAGPGPAAAPSIDESVRRIERFLSENSARSRHAIVAIDESQLLLDSNALETVRLLLNFEHDSKPALTVLLVGQPALLPALERMPGMEQRLGVKCLLRPLGLEETISYVNHRLLAAGASREIFAPDALSALHHLTGGNPRRINRLCDLALLIGFAEELDSLGAEQVESVSQELLTVSPD